MGLKKRRSRMGSKDILDSFPANRRRGSRRRKIIFPLLIICVVVVLVLVAADYLLNYGKIYPGVEVGSVALGGKTPEEAQKILEEGTGGLKEIKLTGPEAFTISSEDLGVDFDVVQASVDQAYAFGRQGGVLTRIANRIQGTLGTVSLPFVVDYNRERLRNGLSDVSAALAVEPVEAGFQFTGNGVSVTQSRNGQKVDEEKLLDDIEAGLPKGQREYEIPLVAAQPQLTTEQAEKLKPTTLLARYRTDYRETSDKSEERRENLRIASNAISGKILAPGEVYSMNEVVSPLHYNKTSVIIEGKEDKADGGGLCQVTSTLYMAANYAGLDMVERHPHATQLPYIRPGLDATVWFGNSQSEALDMKFKNDTDAYILLREWVADDGFIYAEIWGQPTGEEIEMDSEPTYLGSDYSKWTTYKKVKENGKVVFDDVFHKDTYQPFVDEHGKVIPPNSEEAKPAPVNP